MAKNDYSVLEKEIEEAKRAFAEANERLRAAKAALRQAKAVAKAERQQKKAQQQELKATTPKAPKKPKSSKAAIKKISLGGFTIPSVGKGKNQRDRLAEEFVRKNIERLRKNENYENKSFEEIVDTVKHKIKRQQVPEVDDEGNVVSKRKTARTALKYLIEHTTAFKTKGEIAAQNLVKAMTDMGVIDDFIELLGTNPDGTPKQIDFTKFHYLSSYECIYDDRIKITIGHGKNGSTNITVNPYKGKEKYNEEDFKK